MIRTLALTALAAAVAPGRVAPPAQDDQPDFVRCTKCKNLGWLPSPERRKDGYELEGNVLYCSVMATDEVSGGIGWIDCDRCPNAAVEQRLAQKRAGVPVLREELKKLDDEMKRPLRVAATEHFTIVMEVEGFKVGRKRVDGHELLHLYADRLERLYDDYVTVLGAEDGDFAERFRVMLWDFQPDHEEASARFCNNSGERGVKLLGATPTYSMPATRALFRDDGQMHRNVVHNTAHLILSHQRPARWIGNIKGGWADAGLAHWFEHRYFEVCDNYCYEEVHAGNDLRGGDWRPLVRELLAEGELPTVPELFQRNTDTLKRKEHAAAFALVDFLIATDARKLNDVLRLLRAKRESREAVQEVFGWNPLELQAAWHAWIEATYPVR